MQRAAMLTDYLLDLDTQRRALKLEVDRVDEARHTAEQELVMLMQADGVETLGGAKGTARIVPKKVGIVRDWPALWAHIRATGEFELLHKRLGNTAFLERAAVGMQVPGVDLALVPELKITPKR